jgi:hypothetical protein
VIGRTFCALANAASTDHRRCPLYSCKVRLSLDDVLSHLLSHTSDELTTAAPGLAFEGYVVGKFDCEHREGDAGLVEDWCVCGMSSIQVVCPICRSCYWDRQGLKAHIEEVHIQVGEVVTSFRQQILTLIGMEAIQMLGDEAWSDAVCQLAPDA